MGKEVAAMAQGATTRWSIFDRAVNGMTISLMETLDGLGYLTTGVSFLGVGMVVFLHAWYVFILSVGVAVIPQDPQGVAPPAQLPAVFARI